MTTPADPFAPGELPRTWWLGLVAVLAAVAWWALPTAVQAGDAGELSTVMLRGGIPHPSGYPWMRILGGPARVLAAMGIADATAAALPCAATAVAGWSLLASPLSRRAGPVPAVAAIVLTAVSAPVVLHTADAEVWGPLVLFVAVVVRLALAPRPSPWWLGVAIGLAVSHHLTAVVLVPLVVGAAWPRDAAPTKAAHVRAVALAGARGLVGSALGLTPYLTLALGRGGAWRWGDTTTPGGLWHHVSRADYGAWSLSLHTASASVFDQWARTLGSIGAAWTAGATHLAAVALLAMIGLLLTLARARGPGLATAVVIGAAGSLLAATFGLPALFDLDPSNVFAAWILERFDVLPLVLWTLPLALGLAGLGRRLPPGRPRWLAAVALAGVCVAGSATTARRGVARDDDIVQRYAVAMLRSPDPGRTAVVFGTDDHRTFPALYAHAVLGEGEDVLYVDASLLAHPWYRDWLRQRVPWLPDRDKPLALVGAIWADAEHRDTPVFLANVFSRPASQVPRVPQGVLWRVVPPHAPPPDALAVFEDHLDALQRIGPAPEAPSSEAHPWSSDLAAAFVEGHLRLREALLAEGHTREAAELARRWPVP